MAKAKEYFPQLSVEEFNKVISKVADEKKREWLKGYQNDLIPYGKYHGAVVFCLPF